MVIKKVEMTWNISYIIARVRVSYFRGGWMWKIQRELVSNNLEFSLPPITHISLYVRGIADTLEEQKNEYIFVSSGTLK